MLSNAAASETTVYSEGFEGNNGNYTHTGSLDKWEWGTPSPSFTLGPAAAHSGSKCWGTDLDDTVPFNSNAYLTSPAIPLPPLSITQVMRVRFFGWISVDYMFDKGEFQVSNDGETWETKAELFCIMQGGWNEYAFDVSEYAGDTLRLRFRLAADAQNYFFPPTLPKNMAGFYVDDIAITITDAPAIKKTLTFQGNEDQSSYASCPWIYTEGKKGKYQQENDIYSTARGSGSVYTDFYQLNNKLAAKDGNYVFKLKETDQEESFTDLFRLIVAKHSASEMMACDDSGGVFTYKKNDPAAPTDARDKTGASVVSLVQKADGIGCKAYNGDYVDLTFSWSGNKHPYLLLKAQGFMTDSAPGTFIPGSPKIQVQTQNASGQWVTRRLFYPRWKTALCGYDMANLFPYAKKVRLLSTSCHTGKYHCIDWAAMVTNAQSAPALYEVPLLSAIRSDGINVAAALSAADGNNAHLAPGEEITFTFHDTVGGNKNQLDFIVKSRGYYNPRGTYFFYTWNGTNWAQRDAWTVPMGGDHTREFDMSLWLPDPEGKNRVRIWQDYLAYPAEIDFVGLRRDSVSLVMDSAADMRDGSSITNLVNDSDDVRFTWDGEDDAWPLRDRWVEVRWADTFVNTPPSTNPVFVTNTGSSAPVINWTYHDIDGNSQQQYEIEVWSGPEGTGSIVWDPAAGMGAIASETYSGPSLTNGQPYYARVKAFDGLSWGSWSEGAFTVSATNHPPTAEAGHDTTVTASPVCATSVMLDGSASSDIDGDTLSYLWTGPFGNAVGASPGVLLLPGSNLIRLIVSDGKGGSASDSVTVVVRDTIPPIPDSASLPPITGECIVVITNPPTATDNCAGQIVGTTDSLTFLNPGSHTVVWRYDDGNGNTATQLQTVAVTDVTAPVPDSATLPTLSGNCSVTLTKYPTATDNCDGPITGATSAPLAYFEKGTYAIIWEFRDETGNTSTQTQSVVVADNQAPVPDVGSLPALNGSCSVPITQFPTATDNCKGTIVATTTDPLVYSATGNDTINWRFDDGNGNIAVQPQTVTITDHTPPVPDVAALPVIQSDCRAYICSKPTATDDCKGKIVASTADPLFYVNKGAYTLHWTYSDGNGNTSSQTQTVIVADNTPPVPNVNPLPPITGSIHCGKCSTVRCYPSATDNCKGRIVGTTASPLTYCYRGNFVIVWKYNDGNGNITTQNQTVYIR
jgi:hypothetical protein